MYKNTNETYLGQMIMEESRHQFIYGYNGEPRENRLKQIVSKYPIVLDQTSPMGIYIKNFSLPELPENSDQLCNSALTIYNQRYLDFLLVTEMINTIVEQSDGQVLTERADELLNRFNRLYHLSMISLNEFKKMLEISRDTYTYEYEQYLKSGKLISFESTLPIPFIQMERIIRDFKKMLGNTSYFGIIIDEQKPLPKKLVQAVNGLINSIINGDVSIKVACEPDGWPTYYDAAGHYIQATHDYGEIELDDSFEQHMKKLRKNRS